jgi:hypothetical protein
MALAEERIDTPLVLEDLTDEEAFLYCILEDPSGIDQAEFLWVDESTDDNCWRAWDFQWAWWRAEDHLQIDQCARSVGKSTSILARACAFPLKYPGEEMIVSAPEFVHLDPVTSLIERQLLAVRLYREFLPSRRLSITHRPFKVQFSNGSRIMGRIPQRDGKGVKGLHPVCLELDEAQDYPHPGWVEITETLKRGSTGACWRAHGVTKGLRDDFYERTQDTPDNPWRVHRYAAMWRPTWTDEEREEKIQQYGSRDDPDYRRNVLGLHGDRSNPLFVLTRLMKCVDSEETSDYNVSEYTPISIKAETLSFYGQDVIDVLDFPERHKKYLGTQKKAKAFFWIGMDVGYTIDPSEIMVFVEYRKRQADDEPSRLKLLTRVHMERVGHQDQVKAILRVIDFYRPQAFCMDKTGLGLPLYQDIQQTVGADPSKRWILDVIKGYNFSEKIVVDLDDSIEISDFADIDEVSRTAGIRRTVVEYASDVLRDLVDSNRLELPWDKEVLKQFQGSTWTQIRSMDQYGRKLFSQADCHTLDGARMAVLGHAQHRIDTVLASREMPPVLDTFIDFN